jgi:hypothetical protein
VPNSRGGARQVKRRLSLYSSRGFAELDGRLIEAHEEKRIVGDLTRHVGRPSITQMILIKRAARLLIMITQLERRWIEANDLGDLAGRQIVALHNALRLSLSALGLEPAEQKVPLVSEFLKSQRAEPAPAPKVQLVK